MPRNDMAEIEAIQTELLKKIMSGPEEAAPTAYQKLSTECVRLREVMLNKGIGWERLGDMVGYPELVIDVAVEYFKVLPDPPEVDE